MSQKNILDSLCYITIVIYYENYYQYSPLTTDCKAVQKLFASFVLKLDVFPMFLQQKYLL